MHVTQREWVAEARATSRPDNEHCMPCLPTAVTPTQPSEQSVNLQQMKQGATHNARSPTHKDTHAPMSQQAMRQRGVSL
jgi:hypothetical protein